LNISENHANTLQYKKISQNTIKTSLVINFSFSLNSLTDEKDHLEEVWADNHGSKKSAIKFGFLEEFRDDTKTNHFTASIILAKDR
jgi:hypothetical protein